ncbi:MAG TPA: hypothetical protein VEG33_09200, partial [Streptosporangiaceae bacterium]|nr:hypothetical protein [Streptosporangiaceae bacterium]
SYAVLIGSSRYGSAGLSDLPAVAGNLAGLAEVLTDPALGGFPPDRCIVVPNPASARAATRALREYGARAGDTLLVYWAGHGAPGPRGEFQLSVTGAADRRPAGALPVGRLREAMLRSPAAHRILILDCCFSGGVVPVTGVTWALAGLVTTMHRSGGKLPSAGSVSTSASPARLPATAGRSLSPADPYRLLPISTAYERRGSGRRTVAAAPDEGATATTTSIRRAHRLICPGRALYLKLTRQPRGEPAHAHRAINRPPAAESAARQSVTGIWVTYPGLYITGRGSVDKSAPVNLDLMEAGV